MSEYNQVRSFNVGIAEDVSVEAALIYDDLAYAQKNFGQGWFYRSYEMLCKRFPFYSESTIRRHIERLKNGGWVATKVMKVDGAPVLHFQIASSLSVKLTETIETVKLTETSNSNKQLKQTTTIGSDFKNNELLSSLLFLVNPKEKATADRGRTLNARLKEYTPEEITNAAIAFSRSEWHIENKQMSIDNLLAPSKFGRWYTKGQELTPSETVTIENQDEMVRRRMGKR